MNHLRLSAHTFGVVWNLDAAAAIEGFSARGFRSVEILAAPGHLDIWNPTVARRVKSILAKTNSTVLALDIPAHDYNLASLDPNVADFSVRAYERLIALAAELEAPYVTVHGGRRIVFYPPPDERPWAALQTSFDRLVSVAARHNVRLLIENIVPALLNTAEAMNRFLKAGRWQNVGFVYDVANGAAAGENPPAALAALLPNVEIVHLSDCASGSHQHAPIGSGSIDFAAVRDVLARADYGGEVVLEIGSGDSLADTVRGRLALGNDGWLFA